MTSLYLNRLSEEDRKALLVRLHQTQNGHCFICEQAIDLLIHKNSLDIDHVIPLKTGGRDDPSNFAVTHASCNRSKQATNLEVARVLKRFLLLKERLEPDNRSPNLGDILRQAGGGNSELTFSINDDVLRYTLSAVEDEAIHSAQIYVDDLSGFKYFFARLPIQYLKHDDRINPRSIGSSIGKLVEEFYQRRPQLHVPLAWLSTGAGIGSIHIFDGQHKAAAQIMLGIKHMPLRIFLDPDPDILIAANTNAGTTLRQVAFDKSVQRHLGSTLYHDRVDRFRRETGRADTDFNFSERDLVGHFKGQSREMKRYILDNVRDQVTNSSDNKLRDYVDYGGRGKERPLSYSSIDKTFYSFFIYQDVLEQRLDYGSDSGDQPRDLEAKQIIKLMNIIAEEIYIGKFDADVGTDKIENKLQHGEIFAHDHLRAFRMSKEEVIHTWLRYIQQVAKSFFINTGKPIQEDRLFQYAFPDQLWENIRRFVHNLTELPLWVNREMSETVFGGKQNNRFWQAVFETGKSPHGVQVVAKPINLIDMIK